jgi:hypothetical protein
MVLKTERRSEFTDAISDDANANLAIGNGLPTLRGIRVLGRFFKALNGLFLCFAHAVQAQYCGTRSHRLQKQASGSSADRACVLGGTRHGLTPLF